jgi:integrase
LNWPIYFAAAGRLFVRSLKTIEPQTTKCLRQYMSEKGLFDPSNAHNYIFTNRDGNPLTNSACDLAIKKHYKLVKAKHPKQFELDTISCHTFRHSYGSLLAKNGVSLVVIQKLMGHSDLSSTGIYTHIDSEDKVKASKLINKDIKLNVPDNAKKSDESYQNWFNGSSKKWNQPPAS